VFVISLCTFASIKFCKFLYKICTFDKTCSYAPLLVNPRYRLLCRPMSVRVYKCMKITYIHACIQTYIIYNIHKFYTHIYSHTYGNIYFKIDFAKLREILYMGFLSVFCSTKNWRVPRCVTYFRGFPGCLTRRSKLVQSSMTYFMDGPKFDYVK